MSELIVAIYLDEQEATAVLASLQRARDLAPPQPYDAVTVTRDTGKKVRLRYGASSPGRVDGTFWHMLIGFLFLASAAGDAADARSGPSWGSFSDYGIDDGFARDLDTSMTPGSSAIFVLIWGAISEATIPALSAYGCTMLRTELGREAEVRLRGALT